MVVVVGRGLGLGHYLILLGPLGGLGLLGRLGLLGGLGLLGLLKCIGALNVGNSWHNILLD
jgi:hypothetical protein